MELQLTFSKYMEKQKSYFAQRTHLRKREQEYLNILEKITFEKSGIQVFSGSHNEVETKYKTFRSIMEKNTPKQTEVPVIGSVYSVSVPSFVEANHDFVACIPYTYLWLKDGYTEAYYDDILNRYAKAKKERKEFEEENKNHFSFVA